MKASSALKRLAFGAFALAVAVGASIGVVWPIWFFATKSTGAFTLACVFAGAAASIVSIRRKRRGSRSMPRKTNHT